MPNAIVGPPVAAGVDAVFGARRVRDREHGAAQWAQRFRRGKRREAQASDAAVGPGSRHRSSRGRPWRRARAIASAGMRTSRRAQPSALRNCRRQRVKIRRCACTPASRPARRERTRRRRSRRRTGRRRASSLPCEKIGCLPAGGGAEPERSAGVDVDEARGDLFEPGHVGVGEVVGDDFEIRLLRGHARCRGVHSAVHFSRPTSFTAFSRVWSIATSVFCAVSKARCAVSTASVSPIAVDPARLERAAADGGAGRERQPAGDDRAVADHAVRADRPHRQQGGSDRRPRPPGCPAGRPR